MFTGIIKTVGRITEKDNSYLVVQPLKSWRARVGDSVAVAGVCLTVSKMERGRLRFEVMSETLKKTTIGDRVIGDKVNLERSLKVGDELGGHFVYGHVDGVGEVQVVSKKNPPPSRGRRGGGFQLLLVIKPPQALIHYIVPQGSVALDGVSLTVARVEKETFTVSLVPHTLAHTTLGALKKGDRVNIEADMMVKYVQKIIKNSK